MTAPRGLGPLADAITDQGSLDLLLQTGTVLAVDADGTLSVDLAGAPLTLPKLNSYVPVVGDAVTVVNAAGRRIVLGRPGPYVSGGAGGLLARGFRTTATAATTAMTPTTALSVMRLGVAVTAGRLYRVSVPGMAFSSAAAGFAVAQLNYTTDGTNPTASSTRLTQGSASTPDAQNWTAITLTALYAPATSHTLTVLLSFYGGTAGTYTAQAAATWPCEMFIEDVGIAPAVTGVNL